MPLLLSVEGLSSNRWCLSVVAMSLPCFLCGSPLGVVGSCLGRDARLEACRVVGRLWWRWGVRPFRGLPGCVFFWGACVRVAWAFGVLSDWGVCVAPVSAVALWVKGW